jgi:hypothetical protein
MDVDKQVKDYSKIWFPDDDSEGVVDTEEDDDLAYYVG